MLKQNTGQNTKIRLKQNQKILLQQMFLFQCSLLLLSGALCNRPSLVHSPTAIPRQRLKHFSTLSNTEVVQDLEEKSA